MFTQRDRQTCEKLLARYYAGRKFSRAHYQNLIRKYIRPGDRVLDAGCGRHLEFSKEFAEDVSVIGVDIATHLDSRNDRSPFAVRADLARLPFLTGHFDLVISRSVVEHLPEPAVVFRELQRVLKPRGKLILSTPNKYDYVSLIASFTPYRWHRVLVSKVIGVSEDDVFPTHYRANTIGGLSSHLASCGLVKREFHAINHYPVYLMFSPVLFRLGVLYERLTSLEPLRFLRGTLLCVFEKACEPAGVSVIQNDAEAQPDIYRPLLEHSDTTHGH